MKKPLHLSLCVAFLALVAPVRDYGASAFLTPQQQKTYIKRSSGNPNWISFSTARHESTVSSQERPRRSIRSAMSRKIRSLLWPGSCVVDASNPYPLPPAAPLKCPLFGNNVLAGTATEGPEMFYSQASAKLGHPSVWRFYFLGMPVTTVSGATNVKAVLNQEYKQFDVMGFEATDTRKKKKRPTLFGTDSVMYERSKDKHQFLRRLVGAAVQPNAVDQGMPKIVQAAEAQIDIAQNTMTETGVVQMEDVCESFSLDIAWRQIIGLSLDEDTDEIEQFHKAVSTFVSGMFNFLLYLPIPGKSRFMAPYRARRYLVSRIESRIDELEKNGPDGSTLSGMVFATDDDDGSSSRKLTRDEIIENSLILLVAGTETSASTLTTACFLLGLHPDAWNKIVEEQQSVISNHGTAITTEVLDNDECPYLDAVIQETLRMAPLSGGNFRRAKETVVIDGVQIPKGQAVFFNIRLTHELDPVTRVESNDSKSHMDPIEGFRPERWLDETTRPQDFLPFGAGPRRCLGYSLAMAEMRVFLAVLARRVEGFRLVGTGSNKEEAIRWNTRTIIPKPADGVPVELQARPKTL